MRALADNSGFIEKASYGRYSQHIVYDIHLKRLRLLGKNVTATCYLKVAVKTDLFSPRLVSRDVHSVAPYDAPRIQ